MHYTIRMASKISGITVHTLRAWESRHKAVIPGRDDSGRRVYSSEHIDRLVALNQLVQMGHTISRLADKSTEELNEILNELGISKKDNFINDSAPTAFETQSTVDTIMLAIRLQKLDVLAHEFEKVVERYNSRDLVFLILAPVYKEFNKLIAAGTISVEFQFTFCRLLKFYLRPKLFKSMPKIDGSAETYILAAPQGDLTELSLIKIGLMLQHYSKNFIYVGANASIETIAEIASLPKNPIVLLWSTQNFSSEKFSDFLIRFTFLNPELKVVAGKNSSFKVPNSDASGRTEIIESLEELDRSFVQNRWKMGEEVSSFAN